MDAKSYTLPTDQLSGLIFLVRGHRVMLDFHLALLYGVEARALNQAVKRNLDRFPEDFMFQLSSEKAQSALEAVRQDSQNQNSSQIVMSSLKHRGSAYRPYAFTEQGVAMLSSVLRSNRAIQVNIAIMRTFVQLRQMLTTHADLSAKLLALETKYDKQFKVVFDAIRALMDQSKAERTAAKREIGFHFDPVQKDSETKSPSQRIRRVNRKS